MGRINQRGLSPKPFADQTPPVEKPQNAGEVRAACPADAILSAGQSARGDALPEHEPRQQLELRRENEKLRLELKKLQQQVQVAESERDLAARLLRQQTYRISEMQRQLVECDSQKQTIQMLLHSASWRITAPLRAFKVVLVRLLPGRS